MFPLISLLTLSKRLVSLLEVFKEGFCGYLGAIATEQRVLANGNIPTPEEYSGFCMKSVHIPPILRLAS